MVKSAFSGVRGHRSQLLSYATNLGLSVSSFGGLRQQILFSSDLAPSGLTGPQMEVYQSTHALPGDPVRLAKLLSAAMQLSPSLVSERILFPEVIRVLYDRWEALNFIETPLLTKAASYPSAVRAVNVNPAGRDPLRSDSFWMLDLFTIGVEFGRILEAAPTYQVVNTGIYEIWNVIPENTAQQLVVDLDRDTAGEMLLSRFLDLAGDARYLIVRENVAVRQRFLDAIAELLGLPSVVEVTRLFDEDEYRAMLTKAVAKITQLRMSSKATARRIGFSAMVFAEERTLRCNHGVSAYAGYIREELRLALMVLNFCDSPSVDATPYLFYTRPKQPPSLTFDMDETAIRAALSSKEAHAYASEILIKLGRMNSTQARDEDAVVHGVLSISRQIMSLMQK